MFTSTTWQGTQTGKQTAVAKYLYIYYQYIKHVKLLMHVSTLFETLTAS